MTRPNSVRRDKPRPPVAAHRRAAGKCRRRAVHPSALFLFSAAQQHRDSALHPIIGPPLSRLRPLHAAQGLSDLFLGGRLSDQSLDDSRHAICRNRLDIRHSRAASLGNRLFGRGEPLTQLCLKPCARLLRLSRLLLSPGVYNRLSVSAGVGECLFMGDNGSI